MDSQQGSTSRIHGITSCCFLCKSAYDTLVEIPQRRPECDAWKSICKLLNLEYTEEVLSLFNNPGLVYCSTCSELIESVDTMFNSFTGLRDNIITAISIIRQMLLASYDIGDGDEAAPKTTPAAAVQPLLKTCNIIEDPKSNLKRLNPEANHGPAKSSILFCPYCSLKFTSRKTYDPHIFGAHPETPEGTGYQCECGDSFHRQDKLNFHIIRMHPQELSNGNSKYALGRYSRPEIMRFKCSVCQSKLLRWENISEHIELFHQNQSEPVPTNYLCSICDQSFPLAVTAAQYGEHYEEKHSKFKSRLTLKRNEPLSLVGPERRIRTGTSSRLEVCSVRSSNNVPSSTGTGSNKSQVKIPRCNYCDENFLSRNAYYVHMKHEHPRETSFPELLCPCGELFKQQGSLNTHLKAQHISELIKGNHEYALSSYSNPAITKYKCEICHSKFSLKMYWAQHMDTVHGKEAKKSFLCAMCNRSIPVGYQEDFLFSEHLKKFHKDELREACTSKLTKEKRSKVDNEKYDNDQPDPTPKKRKTNEIIVSKRYKTAPEPKQVAGPSVCMYCNASFYARSNYYHHLKNSHPNSPLPLDLSCACGELFSNQTQLNLHIKAHHQKELMEGNRSYALSLLTNPMIVKYKCHICFSKFSTMGLWMSHLNAYHPLESTKKILCSVCDTFIKMEFKKHFKEAHSQDCSPLKMKRKRIAALKTFSSDSEHKKFYLVRTVNGPSVCSYCNESFPVRLNYQQHIRKVHGDKDVPLDLSCACGELYSTQGQLNLHIKNEHSKELVEGNMDYALSLYTNPILVKYKCHICSSKFSRKQYFTRHMETYHPNESIQTVQCSLCDELFALDETENGFTNHLSTIHNSVEFSARLQSRPRLNFVQNADMKLLPRSLDGPSVCLYCSETFSFRSAYYEHLKVQHPGQSAPPDLKCECGQLFGRQEFLNQHIKKDHLEELCKGNKSFALSSYTNSTINKYKCTICHSKFFTKLFWYNHTKKFHPTEDSKVFLCSICDYSIKDVPGEKLFAAHLKEAHGSIRHWARKRKIRTLKHILQRSGLSGSGTLPVRSRSGPSVCLYCDEKFFARSNYHTHLQTSHPDELTPYDLACPCGEIFARNEFLNKHIKDFHKDELIKGNKSFALSSYTNPFYVKYKCTTCHSRFRKRNFLMDHIFELHGIGDLNEFLCSMCDLPVCLKENDNVFLKHFKETHRNTIARARRRLRNPRKKKKKKLRRSKFIF